MSIRLMTKVWDHKKFSPSEKLIMLYLADRAGDDGGNIWPSVSTVAEKSCVSERTVQRTIHDLRDKGYLSWTGTSEFGTNQYRIIIKKLDERGDTVTPLTQRHLPPDTVSPPPLTQCHLPPDTVSPKPPVNHHINHQLKQESEQKNGSLSCSQKPDFIDAMLAFGRGKEFDFSHYPEDVRPIIEEFCRVSQVNPPAGKPEQARWIKESRSLASTMGEFGLPIIEEAFKDKRSQSLYLSSPRSIIALVSSIAGEKRRKAIPRGVPPAPPEELDNMRNILRGNENETNK